MTDLPIKSTFKSGAGYDAPWLTVDAANPDDLVTKLDSLLQGEALAKVVEVADMFKGLNAAQPLTTPQAAAPAPAAPAPATGGWGKPAPQAAPPAPVGVRTHPEGKSCGCGNVLQFKEVQRRSDGRTFKFWECPARSGKNDTQHVSEFAN